MTWRARVESLFHIGRDGYRLFVFRERHDDQFEVLKPPAVQVYQRGYFVPETDAFMADTMVGLGDGVRGFLQAMCDAAWEIGIRPKQLADHSSELKATKYHLEDMRLLVFARRDNDQSGVFERQESR